ncbi:hypothetical protein PAMP_016037 [Pampus punctatissimus]
MAGGRARIYGYEFEEDADAAKINFDGMCSKSHPRIGISKEAEKGYVVLVVKVMTTDLMNSWRWLKNFLQPNCVISVGQLETPKTGRKSSVYVELMSSLSMMVVGVGQQGVLASRVPNSTTKAGKTQLCFIFNALADGRKFSLKISQYMSPFILSFTLISRSGSFAGKQPQKHDVPPPHASQ